MALTKEELVQRMQEGRRKAKEKREEAERKKTEREARKATDVGTSPVKLPRAPWRPARILDIPEDLKDPRFVYRWCNKEKSGNIQKKLSEGWEIDTKLSDKLTARFGLNRTIGDGSPLDSTTQMRELIVMRLPKETAAERNKYYEDMGNIDSSSMRRGLRRNVGSHGGEGQTQVYTRHPSAREDMNREEAFKE